MEIGMERPTAERRPCGRWIIAIRQEGRPQVDSVRVTVVDHDARTVLAERVIDSDDYAALVQLLHRPIRANGLPGAIAVEPDKETLSVKLSRDSGLGCVDMFELRLSRFRPRPKPIDLEWPRNPKPLRLW